MFKGYLCLGGNEIVNNARAVGYARTADCPINWFVGEECEDFNDFMGEGPYDVNNISEAPWWDETDEKTYRFYGLYALDITNIVDSTRTAEVVESVLDGGTVGRVREATREVRVRAIMTAKGSDALDYGMAWLSAALAAQDCTSVGISCGATDVQFLAACPVPPLEQPVEGFNDGLMRYLHNVTVTSGPLIQQEIHRKGSEVHAYIVEFTMVAGTPWVFGETLLMQNSALISGGTVQDTALNLIPYPSAELGGDPILVATNYITNPSVETNATGFANTIAAVSGGAPATFWSAGRNVGPCKVGTAAYRGRLLGLTTGTNLTGVARASLYQEADLSAVDDEYSHSFSIWGKGLPNGAGSAAANFTKMTGWIEWYTSGGVIVGTRIELGVTTSSTVITGVAGLVFSGVSLDRPPTAAKVRLGVDFEFAWHSGPGNGTPTDNQVFIDALAVTVP